MATWLFAAPSTGHGILLAPGTEYWLLSGAPQNPNEAVNLLRSVEDARNAGIPHVIFFSDARRSAVPGAPLNGVVGGSIFPNRTIAQQSGEVDVFFATRSGNPAREVPEAEATQHYRGLFTDCLLKALHAPGGSLVEKLLDGTPPLSVITSRRLKPYLEEQVPLAAAAVNIQLTQHPVVRVETASPKYFAVVPPPHWVRNCPGTSMTLPIATGAIGVRPAGACLSLLLPRRPAPCARQIRCPTRPP